MDIEKGLQISSPEEGVGRVFIGDFHVNVANDKWNLGFKEFLHILTNPKLFYFFNFCFT